MTTKMTKLSVLAFLGLGLVAYGQSYDGKVGINTDKPAATLEVKPNTANATGTTNEGIIAPKLGKTRIASIAAPVEGTLVYATDATYTGTDARVADITEKGYYFYNGTKWVKSAAGASANDQLWAQRNNGGITETYLKPADAQNDLVAYKSNRKFSLNFGKVADGEFAYQYINGSQGFSSNEVPFSTTVSSDVLPATSTLGGGDSFFFHMGNALLKEAHVGANPNNRYFANGINMLAKDVTSNINALYGVISSVDFFSNASASAVIGIAGGTSVGSENGNYSSAKAVNNVGGNFNARNHGVSTNAYGIRAYVNNWGSIDNMTGIYNATRSQNPITNTTITPVHIIKTINGIDNSMAISENATVETESIGIKNRNYINANSTSPIHTGILNYNRLFENTTVTKLFGERITFNIDASANVTEQYGLSIDNVNKGTDKNYAIYTSAGEISLGDNVNIRQIRDVSLASDKPLLMIGVNDGVNLAFDNNEIMARNNGAISPIYLQNEGGDLYINDRNSDPTKKFSFKSDTGNVGIGTVSPAEKLEVTGKVKASGFIGSNGASIFPDYVFQKYYTGTSSLKADYNFKTLSQVEDFVKTNGHLPGYQSAAEIKKQGYVDLMATQFTNVEKIEELYLHSIEQEKKIEAQQKQIEELKSLVQQLLNK